MFFLRNIKMKKQWLSNKSQSKIFSTAIVLTVIVSFVSIMIHPAFAMNEDNASGEETDASGESSPSINNDKAESWRHKAPELLAPRPFTLPAVTNYKLPNGLSVQLLPDHRVPFVTVALGIKAGSVLDPPQLLGLAGMTADMLTEGTALRSSKQIADEVDFIGGALHAGADSDNTVLSGSALSQYTPRLLNIMADVLLDATFPEDELKLKKTNLIHELAIKRSEPDFLLDERFSKVVFGSHPYSIVAPLPETVAKLTSEDLRNFYSQYYRSNSAYLVVVGDFDPDQMKALIPKFFGNWRSGKVATEDLSAMPKQQGRSIYLVDRPGSVQSAIKLGNMSIARKDPDYFPFWLLIKSLAVPPTRGCFSIFVNKRVIHMVHIAVLIPAGNQALSVLREKYVPM